MAEPTLLPVTYKGEELEFEMRLQQGYIPRVTILIDGNTVIFETDDSGGSHALTSSMEQVDNSKPLSFCLL